MGLLKIYVALEDALDEHTSHPHLASVYDSTLARANSLRSDIAYFLDEGVSPMQDFDQEDTAVEDYVRRLTQLGEEDGVEATLLLAHTYVRYRESCNRNPFRESLLIVTVNHSGRSLRRSIDPTFSPQSLFPPRDRRRSKFLRIHSHQLEYGQYIRQPGRGETAQELVP